MPYDLDAWLEKAKKGERLEELAIKMLCINIKEIFVKEKNIKQISTPVTCVGDTHG
jgi:serine/threonine-protein phosphatase PPG1